MFVLTELSAWLQAVCHVITTSVSLHIKTRVFPEAILPHSQNSLSSWAHEIWLFTDSWFSQDSHAPYMWRSHRPWCIAVDETRQQDIKLFIWAQASTSTAAKCIKLGFHQPVFMRIFNLDKKCLNRNRKFEKIQNNHKKSFYTWGRWKSWGINKQ